MILAETQYNTHDGKILVIVKALKTCCYYLKDCKYKVFIFTEHNNLHYYKIVVT